MTLNTKCFVGAAAIMVGLLVLTHGVSLWAEDKLRPMNWALPVSTSPTIDPATCAVYILAGHMANSETTKQMAIDIAYYEGDLQMEHFAAVDRARQELVRSAFEMCAFLQTAAQAVRSDELED